MTQYERWLSAVRAFSLCDPQPCPINPAPVQSAFRSSDLWSTLEHDVPKTHSRLYSDRSSLWDGVFRWCHGVCLHVSVCLLSG